MALIIKDRVKETTTTTGTGTITLAGASTGFRSFADIGNANTTYYCISNNNEFEVGVGTYTASGTTLSRDTVLSNSLGTTALINFSAGSKDVFVTYPSDKALLGTTGAVSSTGTGSVVLSASPTFTGTLNAAAISATGTGAFGGNITATASGATAVEGVFTNTNTGTSASAGVRGIANSTGFWLLRQYGTGVTATSFGLTLANYAFLASSGASSNGLLVGSLTAAPVIFGTNNAERMRIHSSGGVSIGNTTDSGATNLSVAGAIVSTRITPRVVTTTSSATPTINTDATDQYGLTAQAVDITSFTTNLTGTPTDGQKLWIYIVGTAARAITWGASFESSTATLPTTTVTTNRLDVGFVWNVATSKWRCVAVA